MASQKLSAMEQLWTFRSSFPDSWITESFTRDAEILTKALQNSFSADSQGNSTSESISCSLVVTNQSIPATPAVSGSDKRKVTKRDRINNLGKNNDVPVTNNFTKVSKRKSRASNKRSQTTFITADPANFRQMVQQVTGVRFGSVSGEDYASIVKPEAQRVGGVRRFESGGVGGCCLPTLDTSSACLLDYEEQKKSMEVGPIMNGIGDGPESFQSSSSVVGLVGEDDVDAIDFDAFAGFPTLESWKVV